jgi:flavin-dependent dehydrogenase
MSARTIATTRDRYDAIVVGARAAGAATAMLLARAGRRVLVLDRTQYGADTLSTHALMRAGVMQLVRWGVLDAIVAARTPAVRRTGFHFGDAEIELPLKPVLGVDGLYAPRRTVLDAALVDAARDAGADVRFGASVSGLVRDASGRVIGVEAHADGRAFDVLSPITIGADGVRSTVARLVDAPETRAGTGAAAFLYAYFPFDHDGYDWYYAPGTTAGVIPTNDATLVFVAASPERMGQELAGGADRAFHRILRATAPAVADEGALQSPIEGLRRFPGIPGFMRRPHGNGWALVGDAGYFKDPVTAHGLTDALRDAELLARALDDDPRTGALAEYERVRDELSVPIFEITERIASLRWSMEEIPLLLRRLSDEMAPEVELLAGLDGPDLEAVAS